MYTYLYQSDWLFVESISFNIDGEVINFKSYDNIRDILSAGYIQEYNKYKISKEFINELAKADKVRIRFLGKDKYMETEYKSEYKLLLEEFLKKTK